MAHRISGIVPLLFITLFCVGLVEGGYLALEYFLTKDQGAGKSTVLKSAAKPIQRTEKTAKKYDYKIILQRNLFGAQPVVNVVDTAVSASVEDLEETTLKIVLKGTIHGVEESDRAIILDQKSKTQQLYQKGDGIQGAFVKEILRGRVILTHNGNDETLDMSDTAGSAEVAGPVAVAPGAEAQKIIPRVAPRARRQPARRVIKPRIIRPLKPVEGA